MKTGFKFGVAAVALTACIAGSTMWANADSEDEAIKEAFISSQNMFQQIHWLKNLLEEEILNIRR